MGWSALILVLSHMIVTSMFGYMYKVLNIDYL